MRIVFATPLYPPEPGGPATYAKLLEEEFPKRGIEVALVKFSDIRGLPPLIRHIAYALRLLKAGKGANLIFVQDTVSCGLPAALVALLRGLPLVVRVPGDYVWEQARQRFGVTSTIDDFQREKGPWQAEFLRSIQNWVVRRAKRVVVPSRYFAKLVAGWGVPESRIKVVYHGITVPADLVTPHERPKGKLAVTAGRFVPWKGFDKLIELIATMPEWTLAIVGDGPDRPRLESLARTLNISERVIFPGVLSRKEALGWCASADAFVLNTSFESFSFQVAEAMAVGVPVIATTAGSIPEVLEAPAQGLLVAPDDLEGFRQALSSIGESIWQSRIAAAKEKAASFSVERMLGKTVEVMKESV